MTMVIILTLKKKIHIINLRSRNPQTFSYKITHLPEFSPGDYEEKDLHFSYNENDYHYKVKLNPRCNRFLPITR